MFLEMSAEPDRILAIEEALEQLDQLKLSDYREMVRLGQETFRRASEIRYWRGVSKSLYFVALGYSRLGDYPSATMPAKEALLVAQEHDLPIEEGYALSALCLIHTALSNLPEAMEYALEQLRIGELYQHAELIGMALGDLGDHYAMSKDYDKALKQLEKSFQHNQRHQIDWLIAFDLYSMSTIEVNQQHYDRAIELAQAALPYTERVNFTFIRMYCFQTICDANVALGRYEAAHAAISEALQLSKQIESTYSSEFMRSLALVYVAEGRDEAAIDVLQKALATAEQQQTPALIADIQATFSRLYRERGDFENALKYMEQAQATRDQAMNEQSESRAQVLKVLYELEVAQQEADIKQFRLEAAERELEERKRAESEHIKAERLRSTLEKERELAHTKEHILTRFSHEFRTPLAIIRTSTDLLTKYRDRLTPEQEELHQGRLHQQFDRINQILSDIAAVLHSPTNSTALDPQALKLRAICSQAIASADHQTRSSGRVRLEISSERESILCDKVILLDILENLLTNALKFSRDEVYLRVRDAGEKIQFEIEDSGIGIPEREIEAVFDPLTRGSNIDEVQGNGLGLTIVRNYVNLLNGQMEIMSSEGRGTRVRVDIPLAENNPTTTS